MRFIVAVGLIGAICFVACSDDASQSKANVPMPAQPKITASQNIHDWKIREGYVFVDSTEGEETARLIIECPQQREPFVSIWFDYEMPDRGLGDPRTVTVSHHYNFETEYPIIEDWDFARMDAEFETMLVHSWGPGLVESLKIPSTSTYTVRLIEAIVPDLPKVLTVHFSPIEYTYTFDVTYAEEAFSKVDCLN